MGLEITCKAWTNCFLFCSRSYNSTTSLPTKTSKGNLRTDFGSSWGRSGSHFGTQVLLKWLPWVTFGTLWGWLGGVRGLRGAPRRTKSTKFPKNPFLGITKGNVFGSKFVEKSTKELTTKLQLKKNTKNTHNQIKK